MRTEPRRLCDGQDYSAQIEIRLPVAGTVLHLHESLRATVHPAPPT
jgi:hypothetical protein